MLVFVSYEISSILDSILYIILCDCCCQQLLFAPSERFLAEKVPSQYFYISLSLKNLSLPFHLYSFRSSRYAFQREPRDQ